MHIKGLALSMFVRSECTSRGLPFSKVRGLVILIYFLIECMVRKYELPNALLSSAKTGTSEILTQFVSFFSGFKRFTTNSFLFPIIIFTTQISAVVISRKICAFSFGSSNEKAQFLS